MNNMQQTDVIVNTYENERFIKQNNWSKMYILPQNIENTIITTKNEYNQYNIINVWTHNNMQKVFDLKRFSK